MVQRLLTVFPEIGVPEMDPLHSSVMTPEFVIVPAEFLRGPSFVIVPEFMMLPALMFSRMPLFVIT